MTRLRPLHGALLCGLVAMVLFLPAARNQFAYDDVAVIQLDTRVHGLDSLTAVLARPYWADTELSLWRPVTTLTYALDWTAGNGSPAFFHVMNALWHGLATALAFLLILRFAPLLPALAAGLLFAVHPVHVEAVANIVGRGELIAAAASFAIALLWTAPRPRVPLAALLFAIALGAKESAIMLPALLVLLDYARGVLEPRALRAWLRLRLSAIIAFGVVGILYLVARTAVLGGSLPTRYDPALEVVDGPLQRVFTALQAWPHILRLFVLPYTLLADYGPQVIMPAIMPTSATFAGALILGGMVFGGVAAARRGARAWSLVLWWVPIALLPVANIFFPVGIIVAERVLYLPSLAICLAAALLLTRVRSREAVVATALVIALFAARSLLRIPDWRDTYTIMAAQLRDREDSFRAHWHMGRVGVQERQPRASLQHYARALQLWPYRQRLVMEAATYASQFGDVPMARRTLEHATTVWPDHVPARRLAAALALEAHDTATALQHIEAGLRAAPADALLLKMRAAVRPPQQ